MKTTLATVKRTFRAPVEYGSRYTFSITAQAYKLNGNQHPHFSVTGEIYKPGARDCEACGCLHDEAAKAWPKIKPIIALHLSNADDGEPMHADANGYYWLAGVVGGLGEQYYGDKGPDECLRILADHLRITLDEALRISNEVSNAYSLAFTSHEVPTTGPTLNRLAPFRNEARKVATVVAKNTFHDFVMAQRDRWEAEAQAGIALIRELSQTNGNTSQG